VPTASRAWKENGRSELHSSYFQSLIESDDNVIGHFELLTIKSDRRYPRPFRGAAFRLLKHFC
jgi:hypothetical protein